MSVSWGPLALFQQGLQNSIKIIPNLEPVGLCTCLKMVQNCLKVSPGFLPPNKFDKITLIRISDTIFQLIFLLNLSRREFLLDLSYTDVQYLTAKADPYFLPNIKFRFLKDNPGVLSKSMSISAISPLIPPLEKLIKRTLDIFNQLQ